MTMSERVRDVQSLAQAELGSNWLSMVSGGIEALPLRDRILAYLDESGPSYTAALSETFAVTRTAVNKAVTYLRSLEQVHIAFESELPEVLHRPRRRMISLTDTGRLAAGVVQSNAYASHERRLERYAQAVSARMAANRALSTDELELTKKLIGLY